MFEHRNKNGSPESPRKLDANTSTRDEELIHAARRGDKRAFVEIVARHQAMVCGIALGILGDFAASEDAAQDAFLSAWRKLHELREPDRFRSWLAQIARNAALGHLRRTRGHESLDDAPTLVDESPSPDQCAANQEEAALVRAFLSRLPETYRLPLVLFYREGQSVRAVAETLGISEDAVKQRLARGREMLRDQLSGVLENVLTRTAPSVVFTMAIAVAIGALAAPSAIAGTVFTAAAAGTATTTASTVSSTSLLTLMSTSKSLLIATALVAVACIPVGYHISTGRTSLAQTNIAAAVQANPQTNAQTLPPTFDNSALFAEWRELHQKHGTNAAAMPLLHKAIADLKDPVRRRAFHAALVAEWAQVDPAGGLQFFLAKGRDGGQRRQFLEEWLARDPRAAVDALLSSDGPGWEAMARACLPEIARRVPTRVADVATRLPAAESYWDTNVRDAFAIAAEGDLKSARSAAETMTGVNRDQALTGIAKVWAKNDLKGAIAWAKALPDGTDRDEIIRVALVGKAAIDPAAALDLVDIVPAGGRSAYFAVTTGARVLAEAAGADFDATLAWLNAHPGKFGRNELEGLSHVVTDRLNADVTGFLNAYASSDSLSPLLPAIQSAVLNSASGQRPVIWDWLKTRPENETTRTLRNDVLTSAAWQDPDLALRWADDLPRTAEGDKEIQELARLLLNGGQRLHRFDNLMRDAPDRLRQPLVQAAFNGLNADSFADSQLWISRLSLLPEDSRPKAISQIAMAWALQTPEAAVGWVESLPSGEARNGAAAGIVSGWANKDAQGAAEWVTEMPPGAERDRSAQSLVMALAEKYPREAWDWALSIGDPNTRTDSATHAVRTMAARDPATARQWIETGPFTPEIRQALQAGLAKPGASSK
jgi:RNA polymerase sigma factor (sigma-70 family)